MNQSSIDNYDFNNDGFQDLVAANYGMDTNGIAILLNNGDGSFYLDAVYPGAVGELFAVSAPLFVPNIEPVAVLDSNIMEATAGEAFKLNGSQSYDEDGEIVSYAWTFGDEIATAEVMAASADVDLPGALQTHTYGEPGTYTVTLTVTDDRGATASVQAEVHVAAAPVLPVNVAFNPYLLNLHSRDKWITAVIRVPRDYDARQIDAGSVQILMDGGDVIDAQADRKCGFFHKLFGKYIGRRTLSVKFDKKAVGNALAGVSGHAKLKVVGKIKSNGNAEDFSGEGAVNVLPEPKKHGWFAKFLRRCGWK
jgi:PKD repeat protein